YEIATQAQVVALRLYGAPSSKVEELTGVGERTQRAMVKKAKNRGFDGSLLLNIHIEDGAHTDATCKRTPFFAKELVEKVRKDRYSREKTLEILAHELTLEG
ncbi:uncharacterized protein EI97DRAFT_350703, partial [Westerdykella ornata]